MKKTLIFPIQAILKHKQEVCMRGHTRRLQAVTKVKDTVIRISSLLMTVRWMPTMSKRCNWRWTDSQLLATTSVSPPAPKIQKWCTSLPQETHTKNLTSQWKGRDSRPRRTSHTLAAHSHAPPTSMPKSPTTLLKPAANLEDWRSQSGNDKESHTTLKSKSTGQLC